MFSNKSSLILNIIFNVMIFNTSSKAAELINETQHRSKRQLQLLYLNSSVLQFNAGFGFPSSAKNININYAFQANFQLPWNRTQIPVDILHANSGYTGTARKKRETGIKEDGDYHDDAKLCHFYKHIEVILDGFGYNGHPCVLQTLCQLGAEPLHSDDEEDLLHEIASFVLNPMNEASHTLSEGDDIYPYIKAYRDGQNHYPCTKLYEGCSISLIDVFTRLHDIS